jgi:hypothetical protein
MDNAVGNLAIAGTFAAAAVGSRIRAKRKLKK